MRETKPAWKTTEFWLTLLANVLIWAGALHVPDRWKWIPTVASLIGYQLARGTAKSGVPASITEAIGDPEAELPGGVTGPQRAEHAALTPS